MARVGFRAWAILFVVSPLVAELYEKVRAIPPGRCTSYGALGQALSQPVSGYLVGRWMASAPPDVPWHRVLAKDGSFPTAKRDPAIAIEQERLLRDEGIAFAPDGRVEMDGAYVEP